MTSIIEIQNEKFQDFQDSYDILTNTLKKLKSNDVEYLSNIALKLGIMNEQIYKIKSDIDDLVVLIKENNFILSNEDEALIKENKYQKKIINKFLPAMLAYSLILK
jgi:hypothetical protein